MARNIGADGRDVYRAVIRFEYPDGDAWTKREGPYEKPGTARARVGFWRNRMAAHDSDTKTTGHVERATTWHRFDEQADPTAALRAQAYRDAADEINALPQDYECDPGRGDAAEMLRRRAAEIHPARKEQP
jgi:hypothetical protein